MSFRHLDVQREDGVVTCSLSNPPRHTLTATGVVELRQLVAEVTEDSEARVLVLTGAGDGVFVAHYEVGELADGAERAVAAGESAASRASDRSIELHPFHRLCLELESMPQIVIAALNGNAAGGGLELALACDFRLMAEGDFRLGLPETSVGIIPGAGGTQRMARLLGVARALDLILHARLVPPREALELGLVHALFPADQLREQAAAYARDLAGRAPIAMVEAKRAIRAGADLCLEEGLAVEQASFERTMRSKDAARAMRAMLRGETWSWKGE